MKKFTFRSKEFSKTQIFNSYPELETFMNSIDKKVKSKWITISLWENSLLKVSTSYFWNGVNYEIINQNIKTF